MFGTLSNWWGKGWNPKGKGNPGRGRCLRGDQMGQFRFPGRALPVASAVNFGKGSTLPWGGRGRGWDWRVPLAPYHSNPPGSSLRREGATQNSLGKGGLGKGHCLGGDQQGENKPVRALTAASAVASGKGPRLWGGRGRGWGWGVPLAPCHSNPPGSSPRGEGRASPGSKGGKTREGPASWGQGQTASEKRVWNEGWTLWNGRPAKQLWGQTGNHTMQVNNYWRPLEKGNKAVHPRGQSLWGAEEEPFVPIRNSLLSNWSKGRNTAPSRVESHSAFRGGVKSSSRNDYFLTFFLKNVSQKFFGLSGQKVGGYP